MQRTQNSQTSLEKEQSWKIHISQFQNLLYSCSDQNSGIGIDANQGNKLESRNRCARYGKHSI